MTRGKKMLVVAVTVVVCFSGWLLVKKLVEKYDEAEVGASSYPIVAQFDTFTTIVTEYGKEVFSLEKNTNGVWELTDDKTFPVTQSTVNKLITATTAISAMQTVTDTDNIEQYGFADPVLTVIIDNKSLIFGDEIPLGDGRYMMVDGDENVYIVDPTIYTACLLTQSSLLEEDTVPSISGVESIEIEGETAFTLEYDADNETWSSDKSGSFELASTEGVEGFLNAIENPNWCCADWYADDADLEAYGFLMPERSITVNYILEDEDLSFTLKLGATDDDGCRYAMMANSDMVFLLNASDSETLMTDGFAN